MSAGERRGLRWSEQERDKTKEIESEVETKDKFTCYLKKKNSESVLFKDDF